MPKGYWIPHLDVSDMDGFAAYRDMADAWHEHNGSTLLARAGRAEPVEGKLRSRNVLREFPSYEIALKAYDSPEYTRARPLRAPHSACDFVIVEGHDGMQPDPPAVPPTPAKLKGYWLAQIDITEPQGYALYQEANKVPFSKFGGRYLVRGGRQEVKEGRVRSRNVVVQFPSFEVALACYHSPEYQYSKSLRMGKSHIDLVVIEGFAGH